MAEENGGPAFPHEGQTMAEISSGTDRRGMSLRDRIALEALGGMLAHSRNNHGYRPRDGREDWHSAISEEAYEIADAMLTARGATRGDFDSDLARACASAEALIADSDDGRFVNHEAFADVRRRLSAALAKARGEV